MSSSSPRPPPSRRPGECPMSFGLLSLQADAGWGGLIDQSQHVSNQLALQRAHLCTQPLLPPPTAPCCKSMGLQLHAPGQVGHGAGLLVHA